MRVISSMATRHLLADLAEAAAAAGLPQVVVDSMGGVDAARCVADGEDVDLVVLAADAIAALVADGHVDGDTVTDIVLSQVAVAVRSPQTIGAEWPDGVAFDDAEGMRAALESADRIGYSTGPSGTALVRMIRDWGIEDAVGPKLVQAKPGVPVATLLARGDVDLGFQQLSELVGQPGIKIIGVVPEDCGIETVFSGAVASIAEERADARAVLGFFASSTGRRIAARHSFGTPKIE